MSPVLLFLDLGFQELVVVMVVALLLYGGRLPEVARSLGRTMGELKRSAQGLTREFRVDFDDPRPPGRPRGDDGLRPIRKPPVEPRREDSPPTPPRVEAPEEDGEDEASGPSDPPESPESPESPEFGPTRALDDDPEGSGGSPGPEGPPGTAPRQG